MLLLNTEVQGAPQAQVVSGTPNAQSFPNAPQTPAGQGTVHEAQATVPGLSHAPVTGGGASKTRVPGLPQTLETAVSGDTSNLTQGSIAKAIVLRSRTNPNGISSSIKGLGSTDAIGQSASSALSPTVLKTDQTKANTTKTGNAPALTPTSVTSGTPRATNFDRSVSGLKGIIDSNPPPGVTINVRILSATPPGTPLPSRIAVSPDTITGTVTGTTAGGQPIVETPTSEIALSTQKSLPRGTQIAFEIINTPKLIDGMPEPTSLVLNQQWETLREVMAALHATDPAAARHMAQNVLPQGGGAITTGVLFFLSAMLTGDVRRWMGEDTLRILQRTSGNLLDRLSQDMGDMRRMAVEPVGQEWRSYLVPIISGNALEQIKLFIRGERDQKSEDDTGSGQNLRFVIEIEFSRLGPFQFDGLSRDRSIDLMVRTRDPLSKIMREDIRRIYANTISALGFSGTIDFQQSAIFAINPTQEVHAKQSGITV
ncbi:MAG: hypothetical protein CMP14_09150 [Rickettsiales bacterium]|nr:hypothetical protein [Rickettsiales bacterium]